MCVGITAHPAPASVSICVKHTRKHTGLFSRGRPREAGAKDFYGSTASGGPRVWENPGDARRRDRPERVALMSHHLIASDDSKRKLTLPCPRLRVWVTPVWCGDIFGGAQVVRPRPRVGGRLHRVRVRFVVFVRPRQLVVGLVQNPVVLHQRVRPGAEHVTASRVRERGRGCGETSHQHKEKRDAQERARHLLRCSDVHEKQPPVDSTPRTCLGGACFVSHAVVCVESTPETNARVAKQRVLWRRVRECGGGEGRGFVGSEIRANWNSKSLIGFQGQLRTDKLIVVLGE